MRLASLLRRSNRTLTLTLSRKRAGEGLKSAVATTEFVECLMQIIME